MSNYTLTYQSIVNLARQHVELAPLASVGGFTNEPALSLCNDVLAELLSAPHDWKSNRAELPFFVTAPFRQDFYFGGAVAFTLAGSARGAGIGLKSNTAINLVSNVVTVTTLEPHNFNTGEMVYMLGNVDAAFNSTLTQNSISSVFSGGWVITGTPTPLTFTFALVAANTTSGAPGITDFGWLASSTFFGISSNGPAFPVYPLEAVLDIQPCGFTQRPGRVAVIQDLGTGVLKIRFDTACGNPLLGASLVYQKQAPLGTDLTATWAPFTDAYSYVYRQGFLAHAYRFMNSPRSEVEEQKFQMKIAKALGASDRETSNVHFFPESPIETSAGLPGYPWIGG